VDRQRRPVQPSSRNAAGFEASAERQGVLRLRVQRVGHQEERGESVLVHPSLPIIHRQQRGCEKVDDVDRPRRRRAGVVDVVDDEPTPERIGVDQNEASTNDERLDSRQLSSLTLEKSKLKYFCIYIL